MVRRKKLERRHEELIDIARRVYEAERDELLTVEIDGRGVPLAEADELARVGIYETELALEKKRGGWG